MKIKCLVRGDQCDAPQQRNYKDDGGDAAFLLLELYVPQDENHHGPVAVVTWHTTDWHRLMVCEIETTLPEGLIHLRNYVDNRLFSVNNTTKDRVAWHQLCSQAELELLDEHHMLDEDNFQKGGGEL
jgi:hypothetical protein